MNAVSRQRLLSAPRVGSPTPVGDEARGSKLPCGSLDGAESEQLASCEVVKETWGGPGFP